MPCDLKGSPQRCGVDSRLVAGYQDLLDDDLRVRRAVLAEGERFNGQCGANGPQIPADSKRLCPERSHSVPNQDHPFRRLVILVQIHARRSSNNIPAFGMPTPRCWHLRHLAGFGLVRDAEPGPDGRARRWEAVARGSASAPTQAVPKSAGHASTLRQMFFRAGDLPLRWAAEIAPELEPERQDQSGLSNTCIVATPNHQKVPKRAKRLSEDTVGELIEAHHDGDSTYARAERFGIHRFTVSDHLK